MVEAKPCYFVTSWSWTLYFVKIGDGYIILSNERVSKKCTRTKPSKENDGHVTQDAGGAITSIGRSGRDYKKASRRECGTTCECRDEACKPCAVPNNSGGGVVVGGDSTSGGWDDLQDFIGNGNKKFPRAFSDIAKKWCNSPQAGSGGTPPTSRHPDITQGPSCDGNLGQGGGNWPDIDI